MSPAAKAGRLPSLPMGWRPGDRGTLYLMMAPALVMLLGLYLYPLARVLWISVTEPKPGLGNYALLFTSASIHRVVSTTARICVTATVITLLLAYVVAYAVTRSSPRVRQLMLLGVIMPLWVSVLVRSFAWVALLRREGVINSALLSMGVIDHPLPMIWNDFGVIVGMVHYMLPYGVLPLIASMGQIDQTLIAAARGMGAGPLCAFLRVFLPLSLPGVVAAAVLVFIFSLGFYVTPVLLGGGRIILIAEYIGAQFLNVIRWGLGTMLATSLVIVILMLLGVLSRFVDLGRMFGAK